jgi:hypothetical protein
MRVGFNYPMSYNRFGADIGPNPHCDLKQWLSDEKLTASGQIAKVPPAMLFDHLKRNLDNLKKMKLEVIRFFLLANGFNWKGAGPTRRPATSGPLPYHDWAFSPYLKTDPRFPYHFEQLLKAFREAGLQIIPSLISFEFVGNSRSLDEKGLAPGGRADCIKDAQKRQLFLGTMLNDLLSVSQKYKEQIYAWEVINEPYWCYSPIGPLSNVSADVAKANPDSLVGLARKPEVTEDEMNTFIGEAIELINGKGLPSTVGHRFFQNLTERSKLDWQGIPPPQSFLYYGGSRPQFHYYTKPAFGLGDPYQIKGSGVFTRRADLSDQKPFLGEFDSDLNKFGKPWPELQGKDSTYERLKVIEAEGCELALIWPDQGDPPEGSQPDPIKLAPATRSAIVKFTQGVLPPADQ